MTTLDLFKEILQLLYDEHVSKVDLWRIHWEPNKDTKKPEKQRKEIERYFPAPLVGLALRQLRDLRPDEFTPLHILSRGMGGRPLSDRQWENSFTVWLPSISDSDKNLPHVSNPNDVIVWEKEYPKPSKADLPVPAHMIARYVAAMVIGRAVSFAPKAILLDYYSEYSRGTWGDLIERAIRENGGHLMEIYSTAIGCEPSLFRHAEVLKTFPVSSSTDTLRGFADDHFAKSLNSGTSCLEASEVASASWTKGKFLVGIDIGGTAIKIAKFHLDGLYSEGDDNKEVTSIRKDAITKKRGKNTGAEAVPDFVEHLIMEYPSLMDDSVIAIGVSLAAPIGKETGRPLASSGALGDYFGVTKQIADANPVEIHKIDLQRELTRQTGKKVISILNDGDADIKDSASPDGGKGYTQRGPGKWKPEGVTVELKAGTGVAVAVHHDGEVWDLSAESAKAILNLLVQPQMDPVKYKDTENNNQEKTRDRKPEERFQSGVVGDYCSKKGLKRLTDFVLISEKGWWKNEENPFDDPGTFLGTILEVMLSNSVSAKRATDLNRAIDFKDGFPLSFDLSELGDEFRHNLEELNKVESSLNDLYERAWIINQLRSALDSEGNVDLWRRRFGELLRGPTQNAESELPSLKSLRSKASPGITVENLGYLQRFLLGCTWVLGRWLADAIALVVDIFEAREIRLAGGPWSGATGIFVTASAECALEEVYGFDLEVLWDPRQDGGGQFQPIPIARHRVRETKRLKLVYPPPKSSKISGARGAAKAAFEAWIIHTKQDQLMHCRDCVQKPPQTQRADGKPSLQGEFSADDVLVIAGLYTERSGSYKAMAKDEKGRPVLITPQEVAEMLAQESAALGLTRTVSGDFLKYRR